MPRNKRGKKRRLLTWETEESINLTPLLDVIFNLIFFFLLATTLRQSKAFLEVRLPLARQAAVASEPKQTLLITITEEDKIYLGRDPVTIENLARRLKQTPPAEIEGIIIKGDAMAHHQAVVKVLDACVQAGHSSVSVEVKSENP